MLDLGQAPNLGWWPDPPALKSDPDVPYISTFGVTSPPPSVSLKSQCVSIPSQLGTMSCTGQAIRMAFGIVEYKTDALRLPISSLANYFNNRAEIGIEAYDIGAFLRTGVQGLRRFGPIRERDWPFIASKVNKRPSWRSYRNAHDDVRPGGHYRITERGDARLMAIRMALASGHAVVFGTPVTKAFLQNEGPSLIHVPGSNETIAGGHAMAIVGYENDRFLIANSWGVYWRDGGFAWLHEDYLVWDMTQDIWVLAL